MAKQSNKKSKKSRKATPSLTPAQKQQRKQDALVSYSYLLREIDCPTTTAAIQDILDNPNIVVDRNNPMTFPRPSNSFILYNTLYNRALQREIAEPGSTLKLPDQKEVVLFISAVWKLLIQDDIKEIWQKAQVKFLIEHRIKYPTYIEKAGKGKEESQKCKRVKHRATESAQMVVGSSSRLSGDTSQPTPLPQAGPSTTTTTAPFIPQPAQAPLPNPHPSTSSGPLPTLPFSLMPTPNVASHYHYPAPFPQPEYQAGGWVQAMPMMGPQRTSRRGGANARHQPYAAPVEQQPVQNLYQDTYLVGAHLSSSFPFGY